MLNIIAFCILLLLMGLTMLIYWHRISTFLYNTKNLSSSDEILYVKKDKPNKETRSIEEIMIAISIVFVFAIWCASRPIWVADSVPYINYFERLDVSTMDSFFNIDGQYRIGFEFFVKITKVLFGNNFRACFFSIAFFNMTILTIVMFKIEKGRPLLMVSLFIATFGIYYNYMVLRQGLAISFVILAIYYIIKDKKILILVNVLIAIVCFHESAIILLLFMFPISYLKQVPKKDNLLIILLLAVVLYFTKVGTQFLQILVRLIIETKLLPDAFNKYILYLEPGKYDISIMQLINFTLTGYLIYIAYPKNNSNLKVNSNMQLCGTNFVISEDRPYPIYYYKLLTINVIGQLILGAFSSLIAVVRLVDYFLLTNVILLVYDNNYKKTTEKYVFVNLYIIIMLIFIMRMIYYMH